MVGGGTYCNVIRIGAASTHPQESPTELCFLIISFFLSFLGFAIPNVWLWLHTEVANRQFPRSHHHIQGRGARISGYYILLAMQLEDARLTEFVILAKLQYYLPGHHHFTSDQPLSPQWKPTTKASGWPLHYTAPLLLLLPCYCVHCWFIWGDKVKWENELRWLREIRLVCTEKIGFPIFFLSSSATPPLVSIRTTTRTT